MSSMLRACESAFTRMPRHDFRISWTTRLHRQELQAQLTRQAAGGSAPSSSSGPAPAAGGHAPECDCRKLSITAGELSGMDVGG